MNPEHIDIVEFHEEGYKPLVDYDKWRVAVLKYCEELEIQNLKTMQKHDESDEVFVLLAGNCTLFSGGNGDVITEITACPMVPLKLYNVKKGTWHTHTLDLAANVLIVENRNTSDLNSPTVTLTDPEIEALRATYNQL